MNKNHLTFQNVKYLLKKYITSILEKRKEMNFKKTSPLGKEKVRII